MTSNNGFGFFVLGVSVGATAALLFAPKPGAETRNYLQSRAGDAARELKQQADQMIDQAADTITRGSAVVRDRMSGVSAAVDAGKRAYKTTARS